MTSLTDEIVINSEAIGDVNVETVNADGSMRSLSGILSDCRNVFSQLSESEQATAASSLVGTEAMSGFLALMNAAPSDIEKLSGAIQNCDGTAESMANTMQDNLNGEITMLKSAMQELAISFGELLMPKIRDIVAGVQSVVNKFNSMSERSKKLIVDIALIVAAIGPALITFGKISTGISSVMKIGAKIIPVISTLTSTIGATSGAVGGLSGALAILTGPVGLIVAAVAAVIAVITALYFNCEDFRNFINTTFSELAEFIKNFFSEMLNTIKAFWEFIQPYVSTYLEYIKGIISVWIEWLKMIIGFIIDSIVATIKAGLAIIKNAVSAVLGAIQSIIQGVMNVIQGVIDVVLGIITGDWDRAWNGILEIIGGIVGAIGGVIGNLVSFLENTFSDLIDIAFSWGKDFIEGLVNGIRSMIGRVADAAGAVAEKIKNILHFSRPDEGPLRDYEQWMPDFVGRMAQQIHQQKGLIADAAKDLAANLNINNMIGTGEASSATSNNTQINFNGNYNFKDKADVDYFMDEAAQRLVIDR